MPRPGNARDTTAQPSQLTKPALTCRIFNSEHAALPPRPRLILSCRIPDHSAEQRGPCLYNGGGGHPTVQENENGKQGFDGSDLSDTRPRNRLWFESAALHSTSPVPPRSCLCPRRPGGSHRPSGCRPCVPTPPSLPLTRQSAPKLCSEIHGGLLTDDDCPHERVIEDPARGHVGDTHPFIFVSDGSEHHQQLLEKRPAAPRPGDHIQVLRMCASMPCFAEILTRSTHLPLGWSQRARVQVRLFFPEPTICQKSATLSAKASA